MQRVISGMALAALAGALACGNAKEDDSPPACTPSDCLALGASCGAVSDGCGGMITCGSCAGDETCGGGGKPNVCGKGACQPATCQTIGATCGSAGDGCGGTLTCGGCPAGEACGAGGKANTCGAAPACTKTTCQAQGATCGTLPDGCGGELACGDCGSGDACGAGGNPNVCAPIPPTGNVGWSFAVSTAGPDHAIGAGNDAAGNRYLLTFTSDEAASGHTLRLQKLAPDGKLLSTKEWTAESFDPWRPHFRLAVTPAGSVFVAVSQECYSWEGSCTRRIDFGGGNLSDSALVKFAADGTLEWQRDLGGSNLTSLGVNEQGSAVVARVARSSGTSRLEKYQWDGALLATANGIFAAVALDPSGNVVGATPGKVAKYSGSGALAWEKELSGGGQPLGVATTAKGTVVVLAWRAGDVTFGSSQVRAGQFVLYVLEGDAQPRFARGLPWGAQALAVDPTGRAAVVGTGGCGEIVAEAFDLSNADLWRRFLPDGAKCWAGMAPGPAAYGADHRLFLTGDFFTTVEIGGKSWAPRGQDAIGVLLDP